MTALIPVSFGAFAKESIRKVLPKNTKAHPILAGPLRGLRIYTSWHDYPGAILGRTERPLLKWFQRNAAVGETWLDVGAHYGYTAVALARLVGPAGRVFAFEPVLSTAACAARTREINHLPQLTIVPLGLDSESEVHACSLPSVRGMADSTIDPRSSREHIRFASLESLWPSLCGDNPAIHGVKIDVQGMELETLQGMFPILRRDRPKLVIEFHAGVDRTAALGALSECGYGRKGEPIRCDEDPERPLYRDDCSYAFYPLR